MLSELGEKVKLTVFGESHGPMVGCVLSGLPAGETIDKEQLLAFMARRRPGRSPNEATKRINELVEELKQSNHKSVAIVTHGNIMSLLLNYYQPHFGFEEWKQLSNPDVFEMDFSKEHPVGNRIWR